MRINNTNSTHLISRNKNITGMLSGRIPAVNTNCPNGAIQDMMMHREWPGLRQRNDIRHTKQEYQITTLPICTNE